MYGVVKVSVVQVDPVSETCSAHSLAGILVLGAKQLVSLANYGCNVREELGGGAVVFPHDPLAQPLVPTWVICANAVRNTPTVDGVNKLLPFCLERSGHRHVAIHSEAFDVAPAEVPSPPDRVTPLIGLEHSHRESSSSLYVLEAAPPVCWGGTSSDGDGVTQV